MEAAILPDPFTLAEFGLTSGAAPSRDVNGKTLRSAQTLDLAKKNLVLIAAGQSNFVNTAPSPFAPVNGTKIDNLNIYDGAIYAGADPLVGASLVVGTTGGHPATRIADTLITNALFDRVVIVPIGVDATTVAQWETGTLAQRIPVAIKRIAARGIVAGSNVTIALLWGQGESDKLAGTTQAAYTASLNNVIAASRTAGFSGPWFVAQQSWYSGAASSAIVAAQAAVVNNPAGVYAGPNADSLTNTSRTDTTHWSDAGSASYAALWVTALHAYGAPF